MYVASTPAATVNRFCGSSTSEAAIVGSGMTGELPWMVGSRGYTTVWSAFTTRSSRA